MTKMVGVDVGATQVRAVEISGLDTRGFARITKVGLAPLHREAVAGGRVKNPVLVSQALLSALRTGGMSTYGFVLGLTSPDVAVAQLALPAAVKKPEREAAIRNRGAELATTVKLSEGVVSTSLVRTTLSGEGYQLDHMNAAIAKQDEVEGLKRVCRLVRCNPRALDLSAAALLRACVRAQPNDAQVATIVDIGASKVQVITREGPHLRSVRTFNGGGTDLTRAIASATSGTVEEAEQMKYRIKVGMSSAPGPVNLPSAYYGEDAPAPSEDLLPQTLVEEALLKAVDHIVENIGESIESDAQDHGGSTTLGITLTGGSALLGGLKERLSQRLGVPVHIGRPFAVVARGRKTEMLFRQDGSLDEQVLLSLSTAIGLATWREPK